MEQIQYTPSNTNVPFEPIQQIDYIPTLDRNIRRMNQADQQALQQLEANNRVRVKNAEQTGKDLVHLSRLSKTLTEFATNIYKQKVADQEVNETYDALTGGFDLNSKEAKQEQASLDKAAENADTVSTVSNSIEQETGDIAAGEAIKIDYGDIGRGFTGQKAALMKAQVEYPSFISGYMRSNAVLGQRDGRDFTVQDAIRSGDSRLIAAAVSAGRREFIQVNGLHKASKKMFVDMMANTILNADAQVAGAVTREGIKARREEQKSQIKGQGYLIGQDQTPSELSESFRNLADVAWKSGAYSSRGEANEAALDSIIEGLVDDGDVDGLRQLLTTEKIKGNAGTQLRNQYGNKINDAIVKAENRQDAIIESAQKDIEASMYERLAGINPESEGAVEQRDAIIEDTAQQLEQAGDYKGARELRSQRNQLTVEGSNQRNFAELEQSINDGEIVDGQTIEQAYSMGQITRSQRDSLLKGLSSATSSKAPSNPIATDLISSYSRRFNQELGVAAGLKRDAYGNFIDGLADEYPLLTASEAAALQGQAKVELRIIANQILRSNPRITDQELQQQLTKQFEAWWKAETQSAGGKYQLNDLIEARNADTTQQGTALSFNDRLNESQRQRLKNTVTAMDSVVSSPTTGVTAQTAQDFTQQNRKGSNRGEFNPLRGDLLLTQDELSYATATYEDDGTIPRVVQDAAEYVGMTPLALLQQQRSAYGLKPLKIKRTRQGSTTAPPTAVEGAQLLINRGLPMRGASWLSGNIQAESAWRGQRPQWTLDDGAGRNGGILSWNRSRLEALEARYGRPSTQITVDEQVDFLLDELKNYPEANRIFRNPYATDRQLIRASKLFIGYGIEGERYSVARDVERQLK